MCLRLDLLGLSDRLMGEKSKSSLFDCCTNGLVGGFST